MIRTRSMIWRRTFLISALGACWLSAGCKDSAKSDGQIEAAPEATKTANEIAKNYSKQMAEKYADKMKKKP